jgi:hypothetical protein
MIYEDRRWRRRASGVAANAPIPIMMTKSIIDRGWWDASDVMESEDGASFLLYFTKDRDEGLQTLREKRVPNFRGE